MAQKRLTNQSALFYCSIVVLHFNKLTTSAHQQNDCNVFFKKRMGHSGLFFVLFSVFRNKQFLQQINMKNVHQVYSAGIQTQNLSNMSCHP